MSPVVCLALLFLFANYFESFARQEDDTTSEREPSTDLQDGDEVHFISKTEEKIRNAIFDDYTSRTRPCGKVISSSNSTDKCGPTDIAVFVYLRSVDEINDRDMSYDLQMIFRQTWIDQRLAFKKHLPDKYTTPYLSIPPDDNFHKPWLPDTFFINEKEGYRHEIDKGNVMLRITPEGEVTYSFRVTLTLACQMDFSDFPMDEHKCSLDTSSYGHTINHIVYKWRGESAVLLSAEFKNNVPSFEFEQVKRDFCQIRTTTGAYSCLRLSIYFKRIFSYAQFIHLYLPGFVLVCISWLCFWLSPQAILTRAMFGLVCFLTLLLHSAIIAPTLPPTSTTRSSDLWFTVCLAFLACNLLQLVILNCLNRKEQLQPTEMAGISVSTPVAASAAMKFDEDAGFTMPSNAVRMQAKRSIAFVPKKATIPEKKMSISHATEPSSPLMESEKDKDALYSAARKKDNFVVQAWKKSTKPQKFDIVCRIIFPLAFIFFNVIYWPSLHM